MKSNTILLVIDLINEITDKSGKMSGCVEYMEKYDVIKHVNEAISDARKDNINIIHVKVGFSENYLDNPANSPMFGAAKKSNALKLGTWGTKFHKDVDVRTEDYIVTKHRVSAFYGTDLEVILRSNRIENIRIAGVSTNMAVELTAREAHDRDYKVTVLSKACGSQTEEMHNFSLKIMSRFAEIK
jgi:nicotinamidase-related amidase